MEALKRRLARSFGTFFGRFDGLSPVQCEALPALLDGADTLITAPTASGKTEAFAAPAAEMVLAGGRGHARAVFVSPTRALANDLKRRLEGRFAELGVGFGRYTGEHKERFDGGLPEVCVTTPEGLDSLLARRPALLASVRIVVLDEIHVVDGTPRGDQLRVLLHRLEQVARHRPQRVAVSATVESPEQAAGRYLVDARVVCMSGARRIRAKAFYGRTAGEMASHLQYLTERGFRKVLVFCNRRADVEDYATKLKGHCVFQDAVFPHHGSLARAVRERTERHYLDAQAAVAFATMTLELGIDIGTVDYVLLAGPPPDASSLLQRLGRGGRRTDSIRAGYVVEDAGEEVVYRVLLHSADRGQFLDPPYAFRPGVLAQQALACAGAEGWIDERRFAAIVPPALWTQIAPATARQVLDAMVEGGLLEAPRSGRYVHTEASEQRYDRGVLHSNIDDEAGVEVMDRLTGEVIGHIAAAEGRKFALGGAGRKVIQCTPGRILTDPLPQAKRPTFRPRGRPCCSLAQARSVIEHLGVGQGEMWQVPVETSTVLLHGLGSVGAMFLRKLVGERHGSGWVEESSPYVLRLVHPLDELPRPSDDLVLAFAKGHERRLAGLLCMGPWHRHLPADLRLRSVVEASSLMEVGRVLRESSLPPAPELDEAALRATSCL